METHRIRILHISDLHDRGPREVEPWSKRRIFGEAWESNLAELLQDGSFDLVCFTGDAANTGDPEEYKAATEFFRGLLDRLRVPADRLFVVPGNHDVQRRVGEDEWKRLRANLSAGVSVQQVSRWINGQGDPPPGVEPSWRDPILARLGNYRSWVSKDLGLAAQAGPLGYRVAIPGLPLHVVGLDTAWLSGDDADSTRLLLTANQIGRHFTGADGAKLDGFKLVLLHHPLHDLQDRSDARRMLADYADLVLRGHLHETEVATTNDSDRQLRELAAGCLYEGHHKDQWPNACQAITLTVDSQGRPSRIDVRFRTWSTRGHWYDDGGLYRGAPHGRLTWFYTATSPAKAGENPYHPWSPTTADFVGRADVLRRLEKALDEGRGVSVVGDWRMGKSLLLQVWKERVERRAGVAKLLSGENPEGVSVGSFVKAVTGLAAGDDPDDAADVLDTWLKMVGGSGRVPLVLVDETDGLVRLFGHRFFERLRGMLGRIAFVFASRQELDLLFEKEGRGSPLTNKLEVLWLGLLEENAAEELIARGAGRFPSGGADAMRRWAGAHPFFLQLLGHFLVEGPALDSGVAQFRTQANPRLRELWRVVSDRDRSALLSGPPVERLGLKNRGLVTQDGRLFGEVFEAWLREEL